MNNAYILHSGGLDSTALLYYVLRLRQHERVVSVNVDYGQRHAKELESAIRVLQHAVKHFPNTSIQACRVHMPQLQKSESALTRGEYDVPDVSYAELQGKSPSYVPNRNMMFISAMQCLAEQECNLEGEESDRCDLFFGAHADDAAGWAYPDCTPEFVGAMANAVYVSSQGKIRLLAPLQHNHKCDNVRLGAAAKAPLELTWSCYRGEHLHCGVCPTCRDRKQAFKLAKELDPTEYAR